MTKNPICNYSGQLKELQSGDSLPSSGGGLTDWTESVNTASPNATIPVVQLLATNAATNVDIALTPKGTGAVTSQVADNTTTGGNKRGGNAVDLQTIRATNTSVASGLRSTIGGGYENRASGNYSTVSGGGGNQATIDNAAVGGGWFNTASGNTSTIGGGTSNTASGTDSTVSGGYGNTANTSYSTICGGYNNTASGNYSIVIGGNSALASQYGQSAKASGLFAAQGDAQTSVYIERKATADATPTVLALDGGTTKLSIAANQAMNFKMMIVAKQQSSANMAAWNVSGSVVNSGGTLTLTVSVTAVSNAPAWTTPTITASGTNVLLTVTGVAATNIRWVARIETVEVTY